MKLMPEGDHYIWYCEVCDSRNVTLWTKVAKNQLCCARCQLQLAAFDERGFAPSCHGNDSMLPL